MHAFGRIFLGLTFIFVATVAFAQEIPLWEGVQKNEQMLAADKKLIESVRESTNGNLQAGARRAIELGWQAFENKDFETAIRRFNQAWLLDPENPAIYWGFALVTHLRGEPLATVERWFAETEKRIPDAVPLLSDHGRILEERNEDKRAVEYFSRALAIDPDYAQAHVGMARIAQKAGDSAGYDMHMKAIAKTR